MSYVPGQIFGENSSTGVSEKIWKDSFTGSIVQIDIPHAAIHLGKYFNHSGIITLANGATYDHLFKTPAPGGKYIHLRVFSVSSTSAPIVHRFYESTTVSSEGVAYTGYNFNRSAANATIGLWHAPTVTSAGTLLDTKQVTGSKGSGGFGETSGTEWDLLQNTYYLSRITNDSGLTADISYTVEWYEL